MDEENLHSQKLSCLSIIQPFTISNSLICYHYVLQDVYSFSFLCTATISVRSTKVRDYDTFRSFAARKKIEIENTQAETALIFQTKE